MAREEGEGAIGGATRGDSGSGFVLVAGPCDGLVMDGVGRAARRVCGVRVFARALRSAVRHAAAEDWGRTVSWKRGASRYRRRLEGLERKDDGGRKAEKTSREQLTAAGETDGVDDDGSNAPTRLFGVAWLQLPVSAEGLRTYVRCTVHRTLYVGGPLSTRPTRGTGIPTISGTIRDPWSAFPSEWQNGYTPSKCRTPPLRSAFYLFPIVRHPSIHESAMGSLAMPTEPGWHPRSLDGWGVGTKWATR